MEGQTFLYNIRTVFF